MLAVPQRIDNDRDLVARIQASGLPPLAHQFDRRAHLNPPFNGFPAGIAQVWNEHLNPAVRIGPLELLHRPDERDLLGLVEHRARVVRECRVSHQRQNDAERYSETGSHVFTGSSVLKAGPL
jgi:squalene cyclase